MAELVMDPTPDDRFMHELPGVGTLRLNKAGASDKAVAEAGGLSWELNRTGLFRPRAIAINTQTGATVIEMRLHGGMYPHGDFALDGRQIQWMRGKGWDDNWLLKEGDRELAHFFQHGPTKLSVRVTVADDARLPPLALLFGCYLALMERRDDSYV